MSSSWNPSESEEDRNRRMELVRNIQETFYKYETGPVPTLDSSTGMFHNLPLWRVSWTELPGRSNVLNVHEPMYTNMFERIVNRNPPWYFGHLFLPGGSQSLRSGKPQYQLQSWMEYSNNTNNHQHQHQHQHHSKTSSTTSTSTSTAVVGTLMKIVDFRRLQDGRLCLLVHALERFVVQEAIQNLPYSVAHVQILPDYEQITMEFTTTNDDSTSTSSTSDVRVALILDDLLDCMDETQAVINRALAVRQAFQYHPYEFKETPLPLSTKDKYMSLGQVYGSWLSDLLPFASYYLDTSILMGLEERQITTAAVTRSQTRNDDSPKESLFSSSDDAGVCLERRLLNTSILKVPCSQEQEQHQQNEDAIATFQFMLLSNDQLEAQLWNAMEDYCSYRRIRLPDQLLCLLPKGRHWMGVADVWYKRVSNTHYPASRRQTRLGYTVAHWLERDGNGSGGSTSQDDTVEMNLRQMLLEIPTTKARLIDLIQRFTALNDEVKMDDFQ